MLFHGPTRRVVLALVAALAVVAGLVVHVPFVPSASAQGTTIYVAVGGGGNGSSPASPVGSIATAMFMAQPGSEIVVAGGTYVGDQMVIDPPAGTAAAPIRVRTSGRVVIDGLFHVWRLHHWDISGLNVRWPTAGSGYDQHLVKLTGGTHWTFRNAEIWGARSYAGLLVAGPAQNWTLSHLHVHDTIPTNGTNQDHLIYINTTSGPGTVTRSLLVGSPNGRAIKVGGPNLSDTVSDVAITYNTMVDNTGPSNIQLSGVASRIRIDNNVMVRPQPHRNAVTTYGWTGSGATLSNNIVWDAAGFADAGISVLGGNVLVDPLLDASYRATNPIAANAGHLAAYSGKTCAGLPVTVDIGAGDVPTAGDDVILGTAGPDIIYAGAGNDTVCGGGGDDRLFGQNGNDTIYGQNGNDTIYGQNGNDTIYGQNGNDTIYGQNGNDTIYGGEHDDHIRGGDNTDAIYGQNGNDVILGENGNDTIYGQNGNDTIYGGEHDDQCTGGSGVNTVLSCEL